MKSNYITIIASSLLDPISKLLIELKSQPHGKANDVQCSPFDNGYSCSIILLSVVFLEGVLGRMRYFKNNDGSRFKPLNFIASSTMNDELKQRVNEIFVLRDIIAHGHIWEANINNRSPLLHVEYPEIVKGYGDPKFNKVVDIEKRTTQCLKLNVFPTKINWNDVRVVLKSIVEVLYWAEEDIPNLISTFGAFEYKDNFYDFDKFVELVFKEE